MSLILDDRDPDIVYSSGWTQGGASTEYNTSTTYTDQAGATATLTFQGIGIAVYGTIGSSNANKVPPETTYQLDGGDNVTYVPTLMVSSQHYQQFYTSQQVSKGQHTLVVTNIIAGCDPYFIDYLVIQTGNDTSSTTAPTSTPGTNSASNSGHHPSHTGVIAGSVFAVIGGILLFVLAIFLVRRRKMRQWDAPTEVSSSTGVSPFQGSLATMSQRHPSDNPKALASSNSPLSEDDQATTSHRDSVAPPAYIP